MQKIIKDTIKNIKDTDRVLLSLTIIFIIFGLFNIVTVSSREAISNHVKLYYYFDKHLKILLLSAVAWLTIINIPTNYYKKIGFGVILILSVYMLYSLVTVDEIRGAKNWSMVGGITFQPSEFAKPLIIVTVAAMFDKYAFILRNKKHKKAHIIALILVAGLLIPTVVFVQKDFGTMFIQVLIFGTLLFFSPILKETKVKAGIALLILLIVGGLIQFSVKGYLFTELQVNRFIGYREPCKHYEDGGYQICNALIAINGGGLFGLGIGKSQQKYSYIIEPHTDMVFSIMLEEYGLLIMTLAIIGYILIIYRILLISTQASTIRGRYIALGVGTLLFLHIFINLGGLTTLIPLTGVPLPFFSYGGSFTVTLIASLALVQRVSIETKNKRVRLKV